MQRLTARVAGPVFAKEMVEIARRKRYYLNRVLYGLALLLVLYFVYENNRWRWSIAPSIHAMAELAGHFFDASNVLQYIAAYVLVPLFVAGVIASEREERTLELLFTTQLRDREIVLGKLLSRLLVLALLVLSALPVASLILFFGGVDPQAVWRIFAATLLAMLYSGAHAIYFSAVTKSPVGALVRTYWWMAIWLIGLPLLFMIPASTIAPSASGLRVLDIVGSVLLMINPVGCFIVAMSPDAYNWMSSHLGTWVFPATFVVPGGWSALLIWRSVRRLRLDPSPWSRRFSRIPILSAIQDWIRRASLRRKERRRRKAEHWLGLPVQNPLWLRSRRARVYDREGHIERIMRLGWLVTALFLVMMFAFERRALAEQGFGITFLIPVWVGIAALTAIFSATSVVGDRRRGFLELVLMTPLSPRVLIDGALLSIWQHLRPIVWLPVVLYFLFCMTGSFAPLAAVFSALTAGLFCVLLALFGLACSLAARTLAAAQIPTFLFPLLLNIGTGLMIGIFRRSNGPVLWSLTAALLIIGVVWVRRRILAASVSVFLIAVHLFLCSLATAWTTGRWTNHHEFPVLALHPGFLAIFFIAERPARWAMEVPEWEAVLLCYWSVLLINILWLRWWLIRNFERLVGTAFDRRFPSATGGMWVRRRYDGHPGGGTLHTGTGHKHAATHP
jgi:ABC-2 type transport system permease protein